MRRDELIDSWRGDIDREKAHRILSEEQETIDRNSHLIDWLRAQADDLQREVYRAESRVEAMRERLGL